MDEMTTLTPKFPEGTPEYEDYKERLLAELDKWVAGVGEYAVNSVEDPYPWVTVDEDGKEFRTHTAHEDGVDEQGNVWEGWRYAPRSAEELRAAGF